MELEILEELQEKCWSLFDYVYDKRQYMVEEHWTSHAEEVEDGIRFRDDCDGYACTMAELLLNNGIPKERIHLIYCICENGEAHLVCGCTIGQDTYIAENRYKKVYRWVDRKDYQWMYMMHLSDKGNWKKVL